jgi:heptosyltransferase-2
MTVPGRVLIVSPNWLGDAIMALPAMGDLGRHFRGARVIVAARRAVAGLFAMSPLAHDVLVMEWSGRLAAPGARRRDLAALRGAGADVAVLFPNSFAAAWLVRRAGVPERWGYATDMRGRLLSRAVPRPLIRAHQSSYYRHLVRQLGIDTGSVEPELIVPPRARDLAGDLLESHGWDRERPLVVMAPGAAYGGAKRWPPAHVATTAAALVRERGARCVLVGSGTDAETTRAVRALVPEDAREWVIDLAGATTLETLAGVMSQASACVSNDSGAMHLAGAVGVPLAALFGPTRERETAPLTRSRRRSEVLINHVWCRPCMLRECPLDHRCMTGLAPEKVVATVSDLMASAEDPTEPGS